MVIESPTTLDHLYRFFKHDDTNSTFGAIWHVSAGTIEHKTRLYRIVYTHDCVHDEIEVTIQTNKSLNDLKKIHEYLNRVTREERNYDPDFRLACLDLLVEDPWIQCLKC
jgi:hypothetical protein